MMNLKITATIVMMSDKYCMSKKYLKPSMEIIKFDFRPSLMASSSASPDDRDECGDNPWWCDKQPSADDWWGK